MLAAAGNRFILNGGERFSEAGSGRDENLEEEADDHHASFPLGLCQLEVVDIQLVFGLPPLEARLKHIYSLGSSLKKLLLKHTKTF